MKIKRDVVTNFLVFLPWHGLNNKEKEFACMWLGDSTYYADDVKYILMFADRRLEKE